MKGFTRIFFFILLNKGNLIQLIGLWLNIKGMLAYVCWCFQNN